MSTDQEQRDIYASYQESGFKFVYSKRHLSKSKMIFKKELDEIDAAKKNDDLMVVWCKNCKTYMDHGRGATIFDGFYRCPVCGAKVRESTTYRQLEKENTIFAEKYCDIYGADNEEEDGDIPDICMDCDGPYPKCTSTCKFFEEE